MNQAQALTMTQVLSWGLFQIDWSFCCHQQKRPTGYDRQFVFICKHEVVWGLHKRTSRMFKSFLILLEDVSTSKFLYLRRGRKCDWHLVQREIVLQSFSMDKVSNKHWKETNGVSEWWSRHMLLLKAVMWRRAKLAPHLENKVKEMVLHNFTRF